MIRKIIFLLCLLSIFTGVRGQKPTGHFSLIPRAGLSIANLTNNEIYYNTTDKVKSKYIARFIGGVECEYQFHPILSVSLGAFYSQQGCRFSDFEMVEKTTPTVRMTTGVSHSREQLDYIQIPLMLSGYLAKDLSVKVGVEAGCLVNAHHLYNETPITYKKDGTIELGKKEHYDIDTKNTLNKIDVSIPVGISYCYENVILDARYHISLKKIYKTIDISEKNSVFTFTVGYRI